MVTDFLEIGGGGGEHILSVVSVCAHFEKLVCKPVWPSFPYPVLEWSPETLRGCTLGRQLPLLKAGAPTEGARETVRHQ